MEASRSLHSEEEMLASTNLAEWFKACSGMHREINTKHPDADFAILPSSESRSSACCSKHFDKIPINCSAECWMYLECSSCSYL